MPSLDVCFTPELLHLYKLPGKVVVVVDVLRATSSMVTAFAHGVDKVIPVRKLEECMAYRDMGYLLAAERDGSKAEGFDYGNSPFSYMDDSIKGKTLAITTTNGTQAIHLSLTADVVLIGAFLNLGKVASLLRALQKDAIVVCAGWKGNFNLEDTLFAGALAERLQHDFTFANDATLAAMHLYLAAQSNKLEFLNKSSHVQRLKNLHINKDIAYCLEEDEYDVVPVWKDDSLVALQEEEVLAHFS
ncbi:MAG: 2-phosphosulfolactate phosphatase [Hymenobacteraceae bacterium]|nr:2-phosphosulfolactate phosphatase [Hymenobacteraceae bacterium]MDX5395806.1 2-phosphosulfolactate phosphatase [Hymenobacteraceae bacterium]MDX5442945.1 2-phosphosulfolactate phosphatase [Hymenobacteraceae bacterium]MDX5511861.1 2-phosphosulfolactate phosphatase [Hymenobacteraceae bacterium]